MRYLISHFTGCSVRNRVFARVCTFFLGSSGGKMSVSKAKFWKLIVVLGLFVKIEPVGARRKQPHSVQHCRPLKPVAGLF